MTHAYPSFGRPRPAPTPLLFLSAAADAPVEVCGTEAGRVLPPLCPWNSQPTPADTAGLVRLATRSPTPRRFLAVAMRASASCKQTDPDLALACAREAMQVARALDSPADIAMCGLLASAALFNQGRLVQGEAELSAAEPLLCDEAAAGGESGPLVYARFLRALYHSRTGRLESSMHLYAELLARTFAEEYLALRGQILSNIANVGTQVGLYEQANRLLVKSQLIASLRPTPTGSFWIANNYAYNLCEQAVASAEEGLVERAAEYAREALAAAEHSVQLAAAFNVVKCTAAAADARACALFAGGRIDEALDVLRRLRARCDTPAPMPDIERGARTMMRICLAQGRFEEAVQEGEAELAVLSAHGDRRAIQPLMALLIRAYVAAERWKEACLLREKSLEPRSREDAFAARARVLAVLDGMELVPRDLHLQASHDLLAPLCSAQALIEVEARHANDAAKLSHLVGRLEALNTRAIAFTRKYLEYARIAYIPHLQIGR